MKIDLIRTLHNQQQDLLLQQLFTGSHVPGNLVGMVRSFQKACITQGVEDELHFKESMVKRCEIQIGTLHLASTSLDEKNANEPAEQVIKEEGKASGQLDWQFAGINQFGSVTIRVHERSWQVEFSRLQRRISAFITDETALKPKVHQALYEEMKAALKPLASSFLSEMLILQGAPGLGKSHCVEHYFYHEANKHHQMVAWLSGESKEDFLRDWEALANQLRCIDSKRKDEPDTTLIRHWCEEQLGQWFFIIDDVQMEIEWLKGYLPQRGGHVLITTAQPSCNLPPSAKTLSFSPLSSEDSILLLKSWLGKYWEASGYAKEAQALSYFSQALGGSPALLTQIALLVRKKGLSFERVWEQFQSVETRRLLLEDTIFDQLKGQTFLEYVRKSWRQWVMTLRMHYPQLTYQEHEEHLKQFIDFLKQQANQAGNNSPQIYVDEELIIVYWQGVWASLACAPLSEEQIISCLHLLPFSYDKTNQRWCVSVAGLHALACQGRAEELYPFLPRIEVASLSKEILNLPQIPGNVSLSLDLENSTIGSAEIALLTMGNTTEFTTWQLPTTNPYFIPRPALTEEIAKKLPCKTTCEQSVKLMLAAASGMGGIGKTELARHFITEPSLSSQYQRRFWFNAASIGALKSEFYDFALFLGLIDPKEYMEDEALIHRLHRWFNLNPGWLMVLDNADEYNNIAHWIPKEGGAVLITTREPDLGTLRDEQIVKVPLLTPEEALSWLYRLAQRELNTTPEAEQQAARALVDNLGCLPLAIAQAAAYLREQEAVSIEEYQKNFLELLLKDESLIEKDKLIDKRSDAYSRRVIASTWKLSLEKIKSYAKKKDMPNLGPRLLVACSYLAPKDIPLGLLECWVEWFYELEDIPPALLSYLLDEYTAQLLRYSLCERTGLTSMISTHRLLQEVLRCDLTQALSAPTEQEALPAEISNAEEQIEQTKEVFVSLSAVLANYSAEFDFSIEDRKRRIDLISHLQNIIAAWETLNHPAEINPGILIALYRRLADVQLYLRVDAKEALIAYQKQLSLGEIHYGSEDSKVAIMLENVGNAYGALGNAQQQKALLERALPIFEQHYDPEHHEIAGALINLGSAYGALGDAKQRKALVERALPIFERHYGPEHLMVAIALANLGIVYGALGDAQQQKGLLQKALGIKERFYGPQHPEIAVLLISLSNAYGALGEYQQAKILLERALPILKQHYGPEHPHVAKTLVNLGNAYGSLGEAQQQKSLLERALPIFEQHYGPEHPQVALVLTHLSGAYRDLGDEQQQQKSLLERALAIFEQYYGPEHPEVALTLANLGNAYGFLGDNQQRKTLLEKALSIVEQHYGSEHREVAAILNNLGGAYGALGNAKRQKSLLERALPIFEQHYGSEHLEVAKVLANLSNAYGALGDHQQERQLAERALTIFEHQYGPEHPNVAKMLVNLGVAYGALGEAQEEKMLLERALPISEQYYGSEHPYVATILTKLSVAYGALGEAQQAKSLLEKALRIKEHYHGPSHPYVASTLVNLSKVYGALGNNQKRKSLLERAVSISEQHDGSDPLEMATTLMSLADANGEVGDVREQTALLERVLTIFESHYGSDHLEVAKTLANLGNAYATLGDTQQEKILLERALPIFEKHYGPEHSSVTTTILILSTAYGALGDVQQQKNLLERALLISGQNYGPVHLEIAESLINLGDTYEALGDAQQKKMLLEKALPIFEAHYSSEHIKVACVLMNLSNTYSALGDNQQRKTLLERALPIFEQYYGREHPGVATVFLNLGNTYAILGDLQQAKSLLERALPIFEQHYGPAHPHAVITLISLGNAYKTLGDTKLQNKLLAKLLLIKSHHFDSISYTAELCNQLGALLLSYQQPLEAISYYEKALESDPNFPGIHHNLACCYHSQGKIDQADTCFQIGIALFPTSGILAEYAHFLAQQGRFQTSFLFIEQCLQTATDGMLCYGISEYPAVLPAIQDLIGRHPAQFIELPAQGLAHYLQVFCYQSCQQEEQAQEALQRFEQWITQQVDPQQRAIFQNLKNSLNFQVESIALNLLSSEQQLFQAVEAGNLNLIQTIIEKQNVSIDWQEPASQKTTLHLACISQQQDVIVYLLSKMARFDIKDKDEKLAWEYVINTPLLELFKTTSVLFTQKYSAAVNAGIFMDWGKVLRMAVASDYLADVRFLIEIKGIDINSVDANPKTRYTALHLAVIRNKPEIAKYLISKGADVNVLDASQKASGDYITSEQEELLALFSLPARGTLAEEYEANFEKLHL